MSGPAKLFVGAAVVLLLVIGGLLGGLVVIVQTKAQAETNQKHFDCAVSVFAHTEPPQCAAIIAQFRRDGIFPPASTP